MGFGLSERSPRLTRHLVGRGAFRGRPLVFVDVGARGGFDKEWAVFEDQINYVGFEPDRAECERINQGSESRSRRVFPYALHSRKGTFPFYVTRFPNSSGFYPIDLTFVARFPLLPALSLDHVTEMPAENFDSFAGNHGISYVDFIKLDTEGNESDILEGALHTVGTSVMGIRSEASFAAWHKGQRVFADLDVLMRSHGFALYALPVIKFARASLPGLKNALNPTTAVAKYGQVMFSDALYLRDPIRDIESGNSARWDETAILKMACIFEILKLPDCAIELLQFAGPRGLIPQYAADVESLCDLVVRGFHRRSYSGYMELFKRLRRCETAAYYWRRLVVEKHSRAWFLQKIKGRMLRLRARSRSSVGAK